MSNNLDWQGKGAGELFIPAFIKHYDNDDKTR